MDENDLLNFNYPLLPDCQIQAERIIKQQIRDSSLNRQESTEIEKYSDKYFTNVSYCEVVKSLNKELVSYEMQKKGGFHSSGQPKDIFNEFEEENKEENQNNSEIEEEQSLGGGDD